MTINREPGTFLEFIYRAYEIVRKGNMHKNLANRIEHATSPTLVFAHRWMKSACQSHLSQLVEFLNG